MLYYRVLDEYKLEYFPSNCNNSSEPEEHRQLYTELEVSNCFYTKFVRLDDNLAEEK